MPAPAVVLVAAAIAANVIPDLHAPSHRAVEDVVSVALGVLGTFRTVSGLAAFLYQAIGLSWYAAAGQYLRKIANDSRLQCLKICYLDEIANRFSEPLEISHPIDRGVE